MFSHVYQSRKVLITGHTGFKGTCLSRWLELLGAELCGVALPPASSPSLFDLLRPDMCSIMSDIRQYDELHRMFQSFQPEIVFHLAAQPLVRHSYRMPLETFETNVIGTANVLEACRNTPSVRAIVVVTTDKCYENAEDGGCFSEESPLGGHDPYSASKACAEIVAGSYRKSFFSQSGTPVLATARAGNVIGGGDFAPDRLIPDVVRAVSSETPLHLRFPDAVRPWQHVFDALSGYLRLGEKLLSEDGGCYAGAWNFGPAAEDSLSVREILELFGRTWKLPEMKTEPEPPLLHEAAVLRLDSTKAREKLAWHPVWNTEQAVARTAQWYRRCMENAEASIDGDLAAYCEDASKAGVIYA